MTSTSCVCEDCAFPVTLVREFYTGGHFYARDRKHQRSRQEELERSLDSLAARSIPDFARLGLSDIPGAGNGVFATATIPKGMIIGEYLGHEYEFGTDRPWDDYIYERSSKRYPKWISARQYNVWPYCWGRYINGWTPKTSTDAEANVEFIEHGPRVMLASTTWIYPGSELSIDYGDIYFT